MTEEIGTRSRISSRKEGGKRIATVYQQHSSHVGRITGHPDSMPAIHRMLLTARRQEFHTSVGFLFPQAHSRIRSEHHRSRKPKAWFKTCGLIGQVYPWFEAVPPDRP